jgi:hypothetical protein
MHTAVTTTHLLQLERSNNFYSTQVHAILNIIILVLNDWMIEFSQDTVIVIALVILEIFIGVPASIHLSTLFSWHCLHSTSETSIIIL